jgi:ComF family protein
MTYLLSYQHNVVTALITENKFHHNEKAAQLLAGVLEDWLVTLPADSILVPIPLSSERKNSRGYNQVEEILRHVSSTWKSQTITNLLVRTRHTEAQTSLGRNERLTNINGAFAINHTYLETVTASTIVIIDDVVTTGATLKAAEAKLRPLLPHTRIILLGLAH